DMLTSGGKADPPVWQRIFWASAEGITAATLLYAGGDQALKALQAAVVSMGLPFCVVLVFVSISLVRGLQREHRGLPLRPKLARDPSAPPEHEEPLPVKLDRILVPVDYSEPSARAVNHALSLAQMAEPPGQITVLHVAAAPSSSLPLERLLKEDSRTEEDVMKAYRDAEEERMEKFADGFERNGASDLFDTRVELGVPWQQIVEVAGDGKYDAIVIGSHGRSKIDDLLMGSVAQRVIRFTERPVVVVS
ncbi:MAG: universal stress protein, partial [Myxococcota bacterium]